MLRRTKCTNIPRKRFSHSSKAHTLSKRGVKFVWGSSTKTPISVASTSPPPSPTTFTNTKTQKIIVNDQNAPKQSNRSRIAQALGYEILAPADYRPIVVSPRQSPPHPFQTPLEGQFPIYALTTKMENKLKTDDYMASGTIIAALGALSMMNWDAAGTTVWGLCAMAAAYNIYARASSIHRVNVELATKADHYKYAQVPCTYYKAPKTIQNLIVEYRGFPFSPSNIVKIPLLDNTREDSLKLIRVKDESFLPSYVTQGDVETAIGFPNHMVLQFKAGQNPIFMHLEGIRDLNYINQVLTRCVYDEKPSNKKM